QVGGRYKDDAVEVHPLVALQFECQSRYPRGAITFADQVFGRSPTVLTCYERVYPFGQVLDVSIGTEKSRSAGLFVKDPRIAGIHRVDEHNIGHIQDGVRIIFDAIWLYGVTFIVDVKQGRAGIGNLHPYRGRTWSAIERDNQGARIAV